MSKAMRAATRPAIYVAVTSLAVLVGFLVFAPIALAQERPGSGIVTLDEQHGDCNCTYVYSKTYEYRSCSEASCSGPHGFRYRIHMTITVLRDCFDDQICDVDYDPKCSGRRCYAGQGTYIPLHDDPETWGMLAITLCVPEIEVAQAVLGNLEPMGF